MKIGWKVRGAVTSFRDMVAQTSNVHSSNVQFSIQNGDPNLFLPLDVQCSMLDVRRFRADLWMKSFLKYWLPVLVWLG